MTLVQRSTTDLVSADVVTVEQIVALQAALLPDEPRHHGLREVQNWIGTSSWTPVGSTYVPPPPVEVSVLMADLVDYLNGSAHSALLQAALVHAQFETIHPFTDGNGRVGRALIHTVLSRRGLSERAVLPISLVLATLRETYIEGLTTYRFVGDATEPVARDAVSTWMSVFVEAAAAAVEQSRELQEQLQELLQQWQTRLGHYRVSSGRPAVPRSDSTVAQLLPRLPEAPVLTPRAVADGLGVSTVAAGEALGELHRAGILRAKQIDRKSIAYLADDVLNLIPWAEQALASPEFDTRVTRPNRKVPPPPQD